MYTTCLHCQAELGTNDQVEPFPVGRKLAFDQAKERLWVVCAKCTRWNLSPLDERGEAIDVCEKLYHDTVLRRSTGEIGLARLPSGLELVRIGRPVFPEYADWRYGERFKRRRWIHLGTTAVLVAGGVGLLWGLPALAASAGFGAGGLNWVFHAVNGYRERVRSRRVVGSYYRVLSAPPERLLGAHVKHMTIEATDPVRWRIGLPKLSINWFQLEVQRRYRTHWLGFIARDELPNPVLVAPGDEARLLTSTIHQINDSGGSPDVVEQALQVYDQERGDVFQRIGSLVHAEKHHRVEVSKLPLPTRLALEIQLAEKRDAAWLDGELSSLTAAWKEAEEIAAIADDLTGPRWIDAELRDSQSAAARRDPA